MKLKVLYNPGQRMQQSSANFLQYSNDSPEANVTFNPSSLIAINFMFSPPVIVFMQEIQSFLHGTQKGDAFMIFQIKHTPARMNAIYFPDGKFLDPEVLQTSDPDILRMVPSGLINESTRQHFMLQIQKHMHSFHCFIEVPAHTWHCCMDRLHIIPTLSSVRIDPEHVRSDPLDLVLHAYLSLPGICAHSHHNRLFCILCEIYVIIM